MGTTFLSRVLRRLWKKSIVIQDKRGKSHMEKSTKSTLGPADFFRRQTREGTFTGQRGDNAYAGVPQNVSKTYRQTGTKIPSRISPKKIESLGKPVWLHEKACPWLFAEVSNEEEHTHFWLGAQKSTMRCETPLLSLVCKLLYGNRHL